MENIKIKGISFSKKELQRNGYDPNGFSYLVNVFLKTKDKTIVLNKCKVIESGDNEEPFFIAESEDRCLIFKQSENPNMTIEKLLLN
jgi:hypothetical protein